MTTPRVHRYTLWRGAFDVEGPGVSDHYLIYVRQSYRRKGENADADVSPEAQEKATRAALPSGSTAEVISDTGGHRSGRTDARDGYQQLIKMNLKRAYHNLSSDFTD